MPGFVESIVEDKARNRVTRDISMIESEWPAHTPAGITSISGYCTPASESAATLLAIPSAMWFKPRTLIVDNQSAALNHLTIYEGGSASACSGIVFPMYVEGRTTVFVALDCITCGKDLYVQAETVGNTTVKVGGILIPSGFE